jgi:hypothetical protein
MSKAKIMIDRAAAEADTSMKIELLDLGAYAVVSSDSGFQSD